MARLPRYTLINQPQHIMQLGRDGQQIFFEEQDYQYFRDCLDAAAFNYGLKVHAYALMPDHVHVLASPGRTDSVSRTIQSVGRNYVQYFNQCYGGLGTLWEGRYRATVVEPGELLLTCSRYIELNPVRAGLVTRANEFRWSSYAHNAECKADGMISAHETYRGLGADDRQRCRAYRALFKKKIDDGTARQITEATLKGWALGDSKFLGKIEKLCRRRARQLPKGRPRGSRATLDYRD